MLLLMDLEPKVSVFASGFDSPRGLAFGPDGHLYVAEAGRGGSTSTVGRCRQIPPPVGPYTGGFTSRITKVGPGGTRLTVADGLPSSRSTPESGATVTGVADLAFVDGELYALVSGAGCSHGLEGTANGVYRIGKDGSATLVADLGAYRAATTVAVADPSDDEYDGTWYSMVALDGFIYTVEPNHGDMIRVGFDGRIERLVDLSASQGHIVPTAVAYNPELDALFVGNLGRLPATPGSAKILRVNRDGEVDTWSSGLMTVLGLALDARGVLYALENTVCDQPCRPRPDSGRIVRIGPDRSVEPVAGGLNLPTALAFAPDGALFVSTAGLGPPGAGTIVRIEF